MPQAALRQQRELRIEREEFDIREVMVTLIDVIGLLFLIIASHDPAAVLDVYVATTHLYVIVSRPLGAHARVIGYAARTTIRKIRI